MRAEGRQMNQTDKNIIINTIIIPGESAGGIKLNSNVDDVISNLHDRYRLDADARSIIINEGMITIYHNDAGIIHAISCSSTYKGSYQSKLWPGMTVQDVLRTTKEQDADLGFVIFHKIQGIGLLLPQDRDDFERLNDHLSDDFVLEELWVFNH
jgi:hypothetical protein